VAPLSARDRAFAEEIRELLAPLGDVTVRAMFGGRGVFHDRAMFALLADATLYLKLDDSNRARLEQAGCTPFVPYPDETGARRTMPYYEAPAELGDDAGALHQWARTSIAVAHASAKPRRRRTSRR
jgi:DNA transformation protein